MSASNESKSSPVDLLYGAAAIAEAMNMTEAQVYHLHARKELPAFKIRGRVCARRSHLNEWLDRLAQRAIEGEHAGE